MTPTDQQTRLIVGGGLAGAKAAEALRAEGFEGRIVLVANVAHPFYGGRLRVEHWASALHQPEVAARSMLGKPAAGIGCRTSSPTGTTSGWSLGPRLGGGRGPRPRRPRRAGAIAFWLRDDRVVAAMNVDVWDVTDDLRALIRARQPVDRARLAGPGIPLADLLPAAHPA